MLKLMDKLANSYNLWVQRISIVSTMATLKAKDTSYTLRYAKEKMNKEEREYWMKK